MNEADQPVVLVTGGASGIGRAIVASFIEEGAHIHVLDADDRHIADFQALFPDASVTHCDVCNVADVDRAFQSIRKLDVLVNNAGIAGPAGRVETLDVEGWNHCIAVNLSGTFYVTRRAVPLLKQSAGGVIVNIASNAGLMGCPDRSPYVASKWAMVGLTKTWAMELGPDNIRVNAVCPTSVEGDRIDDVIARDAERLGKTPDEIRDIYQRQSSMRTFVTHEDVADMVLFLTSDRANRISGQIIAVDGHTETLAVELDAS